MRRQSQTKRRYLARLPETAGRIDVLVCGKCGHIYSLAEVNARKYDHHLCLLCGSHELRTEKL